MLPGGHCPDAQTQAGRPDDQHRLRSGAATPRLHPPSHAASKFKVAGITQSLAKEVAKKELRLLRWHHRYRYVGRAPRRFGKFSEQILEPGELMAEWARGIPMGRAVRARTLWGLVTFLSASDDAAEQHHGLDDQRRWWVDNVMRLHGLSNTRLALFDHRAFLPGTDPERGRNRNPCRKPRKKCGKKFQNGRRRQGSELAQARRIPSPGRIPGTAVSVEFLGCPGCVSLGA